MPLRHRIGDLRACASACGSLLSRPAQGEARGDIVTVVLQDYGGAIEFRNVKIPPHK